MAIIAGISPASICDEEDLIVAVEMILIDMLRGIASSEGRCGNTLDFIVHRSGDVAAQRYEIRVESAESASERRRARGKWIAGLEAGRCSPTTTRAKTTSASPATSGSCWPPIASSTSRSAKPFAS